jgi:large subunit ribosomal protein L23
LKAARSIIRRALITEKGTAARERGNQYFFEVAKAANKIEIKKAIEEVFSVTVTDVRTMSRKGKTKRLGVFSGRRSHWKKAVVTLKAGDSIDMFEEV